MMVDVVSEGPDCPKGEGNRFRITPFPTPGYFINIFISQRISNSSCLSPGCLLRLDIRSSQNHSFLVIYMGNTDFIIIISFSR